MSQTTGQVHIIGAGLLGTSIGLRLTSLGVQVSLEDQSEDHLQTAIKLGAGRNLLDGDQISTVVVCVPPEATAQVVAQALDRFPNSVVTEIASVKSEIHKHLALSDSQSKRFISSHPMAGKEISGPEGATADLFIGKPWVIVGDSSQEIEALATDLGAVIIYMGIEEHDEAVAKVSHLPQVISSLLAGMFAEDNQKTLSISGTGLADTTRIAASDADLWIQILISNRENLVPLLESYSKALQLLIEDLKSKSDQEVVESIKKLMKTGNSGKARIEESKP